MLIMSDESLDDNTDKEKIVLDIIRKYLDLTPAVMKRSDASKTVKERDNDGMISIYTTFLFHEIEKFSKLITKI